MKTWILLTSLATLIGAPSSSNIEANIRGIRGAKGTIRCALYKGKRGFPSEKQHALKIATSKISNAKARCVFAGVPKGQYAIAVFHDANDNRKLDTNFFGIPQEGFGASNDAPPGATSPPKYKDAAFSVQNEAASLQINLRY